MNPRHAVLLALSFATMALGGCLQLVGDEGPARLPGLTVGTIVHVTGPGQDGVTSWSLLGFETRAGAYGTEEDLLVFRSGGSSEPVRLQYYTLNEKEISILETEAFGVVSWNLRAPSPICFIPLPLHYAVLLSGADVPTRATAQSIAGVAFEMNLVPMPDHLLLTLENPLVKTEASVRILETEAGYDLAIESITSGSPEGCEVISGSTMLSVELGEGDPVQLRHGLVDPPWEPVRFDWWPGFDTPSAEFPLERAARALKANLAFQEFAAGGQVWPFWLHYREHLCSSLPVWQWAFLLEREDGKGFGACVAQLPGSGILPLAVVVDTWEQAMPGFTPSHRVEAVDFRFMDAATAALAPEKVGALIHLEFRTTRTDWEGNPIAWVDVRREDPEQEGYAYICEFDGSTGRVSYCSNLPANIVPGL